MALCSTTVPGNMLTNAKSVCSLKSSQTVGLGTKLTGSQRRRQVVCCGDTARQDYSSKQEDTRHFDVQRCPSPVWKQGLAAWVLLPAAATVLLMPRAAFAKGQTMNAASAAFSNVATYSHSVYTTADVQPMHMRAAASVGGQVAGLWETHAQPVVNKHIRPVWDNTIQPVLNDKVVPVVQPYVTRVRPTLESMPRWTMLGVTVASSIVFLMALSRVLTKKNATSSTTARKSSSAIPSTPSLTSEPLEDVPKLHPNEAVTKAIGATLVVRDELPSTTATPSSNAIPDDQSQASSVALNGSGPTVLARPAGGASRFTPSYDSGAGTPVSTSTSDHMDGSAGAESQDPPSAAHDEVDAGKEGTESSASLRNARDPKQILATMSRLERKILEHQLRKQQKEIDAGRAPEDELTP